MVDLRNTVVPLNSDRGAGGIPVLTRADPNSHGEALGAAVRPHLGRRLKPPSLPARMTVVLHRPLSRKTVAEAVRLKLE